MQIFEILFRLDTIQLLILVISATVLITFFSFYLDVARGKKKEEIDFGWLFGGTIIMSLFSSLFMILLFFGFNPLYMNCVMEKDSTHYIDKVKMTNTYINYVDKKSDSFENKKIGREEDAYIYNYVHFLENETDKEKVVLKLSEKASIPIFLLNDKEKLEEHFYEHYKTMTIKERHYYIHESSRQ